MVALSIRTHPQRCEFCEGEGEMMMLDAVDYERQAAARIIRESARKYDVPPQEVIGPLRIQRIVDARREAAYRMRYELRLGLDAVGRYLGHRHHATIVHSINRYAEINGIDLSDGHDIRREW